MENMNLDKIEARFIGQDPNANADLLAHDQKQMEPIFAENYLTWLPADRAAKILDFGCGYGTFLRFLESKGCKNVTGFDPDSRCVKFCRANGASLVEISDDSFQYLKGKSGLALLSAQGVLNYFDRQSLGELFRCFHGALAKEGVLLVEVPNAAGITGMMEYTQDPFMKSFYTDVLLRILAEQAGLKVEYIGGLKLPPKGLKRAIWLAGQRTWHAALRLVYLIEKGRSERIPKEFGSRLVLVARRVD